MKKALVFILAFALILTVAVPYLQFVIQRGALDTDLAMIMMDYQTMGAKKFATRVDRICLKNRLQPGEYSVDINEDKNAGVVRVAINYSWTFKFIVFKHVEHVVLENEAKMLGL